MSDDVEAEAEALEAVREAGLGIGPDQATPVFNPGAIAAAVFDLKGRLVAASPAFTEVDGASRIDPQVFARVAAGGGPDMSLFEMGAGGDFKIFAYGRLPGALAWRLPTNVRAAAQTAGRGVVVLTAHATGDGPLEDACRAYGLSGLQTRVALATVATGNVRRASERAGVSYDTGREALAEAFRRVGVSRLPALVGRLASLAFGVLPDEDAAVALADHWGLTARQAAIAALVGDGLSRDQAARSLGVSEAVVKKELEYVFQLLGISTAAGLARKIVETRALRWLMHETSGEVGFLEPAFEPLQYVSRPGGGRIAVSDYGPPGGRPVLVVHSSMTSRVVGRRLLRSLHAAGYRPISIDRPGFGLSDEAPGMRPGAHDPYAVAARDALLVLDRLKIRRIDVAARGGAQFVTALHRAAPERVGAVVLVNPDPHNANSARNVGPYGRMKEAYQRNPRLIRLSARLLTKGLTLERTARMMQAWMDGSAPDEIAIRDADLVRDYYHAQRMFALGKLAGYVNEQTDFARGARPPPLPEVRHWQVLVAEHDTLHDPKDVMAYWTGVLPNSEFRIISEAGRLMALSHPHLVVDALARSAAADPRST